ncbi:9956_t:CDS:2 [Scutellospora calospora]|uniref:9956_t:CDS:1 n=1 Tax=Scutellospora calospora TaxID=85575 RepID=A0ACA9KAQ2_9GLOM|nr:9956_t:CDS:2 [Scutellospora calospora]
MDNIITNNKILSSTQKQDLQNKILRRRENLFPVIPPVNEDTIFDEIKNSIITIDMNKITEVRKLLENGNIDQNIKNSRISYNKINELQNLRKDKLNYYREKSIDEFNKNIDKLKTEQELDDLKNVIRNNDLLLDTQKQTLNEKINEIKNKINEYNGKINRSNTVDEIDNVIDELSADNIISPELKTELTKLSREKKNKIIEEIYTDKIDKSKTTKEVEDVMDELLKDNILPDDSKTKLTDSLDEKYLTDNRNKIELNRIRSNKENSLIDNFRKEENDNYNSLVENIRNCEDSNLLTSEFYNDIYRNIEDLNKNYLSPENTKQKLHQLREERKNILENI